MSIALSLILSENGQNALYLRTEGVFIMFMMKKPTIILCLALDVLLINLACADLVLHRSKSRQVGTLKCMAFC